MAFYKMAKYQTNVTIWRFLYDYTNGSSIGSNKFAFKLEMTVTILYFCLVSSAACEIQYTFKSTTKSMTTCISNMHYA